MRAHRSPPRTLRPALNRRSDLRPIILRMISTNSLAAFTPEVSRSQVRRRPRAATAMPPGGAGRPAAWTRRARLDAVPAQPSPVPRGSLLDLRV